MGEQLSGGGSEREGGVWTWSEHLGPALQELGGRRGGPSRGADVTSLTASLLGVLATILA